MFGALVGRKSQSVENNFGFVFDLEKDEKEKHFFTFRHTSHHKKIGNHNIHITSFQLK